MRQIVLDTETTGLEPTQGHRIIEIGGVEIIDRRITRRYFHQYINPQREIDSGAVKVHGLTTQFLSDKPLFADVANEFFNFIDGAELVIHNAPFDLGFLNHEYSLIKKPKRPKLQLICPIIDTLVLARKMHPGQRNSLDALCKRYDVDNSNRDLHGALLDARLLALVYLAMTGGQSQLFSEAKQELKENKKKETVITKQKEIVKTPLILANSEELNSHHEFLEKIKANNNSCLWLDD